MLTITPVPHPVARLAVTAFAQDLSWLSPLPSLATRQVREALLKNIKRRMTPQPLKIRADVEMTCFTYDGIEHIKSAIRAAEATSTEECPVKMKLVAPPLYVLTTQTLDKNKGVEVLTAGESGRGGRVVAAAIWFCSCLLRPACVSQLPCIPKARARD